MMEQSFVHDPIAPYDGALPHQNGEAIDLSLTVTPTSEKL